MSASEPEADTKYSRGPRLRRGRLRRSEAAVAGPSRAAATALGVALVGAVLLVIAEFEPLLHVRSDQRGTGIIATTQTGSHHSYALIPLALLTVALVVGARRSASWPVGAALAVLGLIALGIALLGDLPDARATGLIISSPGTYASAQASPAIGFFLETLGAVLLIAAGGATVLLRAPGAAAGGAGGDGSVGQPRSVS
jgi:hypothetical protein